MKHKVNTIRKSSRTAHEVPVVKTIGTDEDTIIQKISMLREVEITEMVKSELYFWSHHENLDLLTDSQQQELLHNCQRPGKRYYAVPPSAGKIRIRTENE